MLLFLDGQAHYDSSRIDAKWSTVGRGATSWSVTAEGRFGNCLKRVSDSNFSDGYLDIAPLTSRTGLWTPNTSGVCGFAVRVDDLTKVDPNYPSGSYADANGLIAILEGTQHHVKVMLHADGTFSLWRGEGLAAFPVTLLAVSTEGLQSGSWAFVEFKWSISATAGSCELRVNTLPVLTYSGKTLEGDPAVATLGVWNAVRLLKVKAVPTVPMLTIRLCDFYLADLTTADSDDVHDFLGDGIIRTIFPNGAGASAGWTPNGVAANWDATNDRPAPDDDGTYVRATVPGTRDVYNFDNIPAGSLVKGAQVVILAKKEDEGATVLAPLVHPTTVDYLAPTPQGVASTAYDRYLTQPWDLNPETMAPWTDTDINNGQYGFIKTT